MPSIWDWRCGAAQRNLVSAQYSDDPKLADRHGRGVGYTALGALATLPAPGCGRALEAIVESGAPLALWGASHAALSAAVRCDYSELPVELKPIPPAGQLAARWASMDPLARAERLQRAQRLHADFQAEQAAGTLERLTDHAVARALSFQEDQ